MNESTPREARKPTPSQTVTAFDPSAHRRPASRPCMALVTGSGPHITEELNDLLRRRLRVAGLIGLAGFGSFFVKHQLFPSAHGPESFDHSLHALVVAMLVVTCALLWSSVPITTRVLRGLELTMFGTMAVFFAIVQIEIFAGGNFLGWAKTGFENEVNRLGTISNAFRWFLLIVLYGTFIPNTWKRSALVVGTLALTPLVLMFLTCFRCSIMGRYTGASMFDMTLILAMGSAIAIFGSYKISSLQQQANQARKLGQYQLHRKLGAGGMGEVYLGEHLLLKRACAIKLIRPDQAGDPTTLSRFVREVQAMATLTHWNTVEVYDYGNAEDGTFYYVMEYLPGLSLQDLVEEYGPLPPGRAIWFLRQVCAALREAHAVGLIHRDIKPSNVIACRRGAAHDVAKLLDFGLVHDHALDGHVDHKLTIQGAILGSPPYISPEQARGRGHVDARSDIYSLGGLAYYLVTGQSPFVRDTVMELLVAHLHEVVQPPRELRPELPHDLEEVILTCLRKDPAERYPDVASLDRALSRCEAADQWDADRAEVWWRDRDRGAEKVEVA
jgi:serine/threonine-protein kinase